MPEQIVFDIFPIQYNNRPPKGFGRLHSNQHGMIRTISRHSLDSFKQCEGEFLKEQGIIVRFQVHWERTDQLIPIVYLKDVNRARALVEPYIGSPLHRWTNEKIVASGRRPVIPY